MPVRKKRRGRAKPEEEYSLFVLRVDHYDVRAHAGINRYAHASQYAWRDTEEEPLYEFETDLEIKGTCTYLENRIGDRCELTIYGDVSPESQIYWKLKDVQIVDDHCAKKYREYRSNRIPVYDPPKGMGMFDKARASRTGAARSGHSRASSPLCSCCSPTASHFLWQSPIARSSGPAGFSASRCKRTIERVGANHSLVFACS